MLDNKTYPCFRTSRSEWKREVRREGSREEKMKGEMRRSEQCWMSNNFKIFLYLNS